MNHPDFVDLATYLPEVVVDPRYAGSENFLGYPVPGYDAPCCPLSRRAADALGQVARKAQALGMRLKIFDGYRPQRAVDHFVQWTENLADERMRASYYPDLNKRDLLAGGYISRRSGHSRGSAVDLTLIIDNPAACGQAPGGWLANGEMNMGTPFDFFGPASHTDCPAMPADILANRHVLADLMGSGGFVGIAEEWWHFSLAKEAYPESYFDLPVSLFRWSPPPRRASVHHTAPADR